MPAHGMAPSTKYWSVPLAVDDEALGDVLDPGATLAWKFEESLRGWAAGDVVFYSSQDGKRVVGLGHVEAVDKHEHEVRIMNLTDAFPLGVLFKEPATDTDLPQGGAGGRGAAKGIARVRPDRARRVLSRIRADNPFTAPLCDRWLAPLGGAENLDRRLFEALRAGPNFVAGKGVRTVSVRQPWAWAILCGGKDVENRKKTTKVRGTVALHASKARPDADDLAWLGEMGLVLPKAFALGAIIGTVDIVGCVDDSDSLWAEDDSQHWLLARARALLNPIEAKGALGFWSWMPPD